MIKRYHKTSSLCFVRIFGICNKNKQNTQKIIWIYCFLKYVITIVRISWGNTIIRAIMIYSLHYNFLPLTAICKSKSYVRIFVGKWSIVTSHPEWTLAPSFLNPILSFIKYLIKYTGIIMPPIIKQLRKIKMNIHPFF